MTDTTLPTRVGLGHRVNTDPRATASREALEAFNASEAGRQLEEAAKGPDWKAQMAALDEAVKDRYEAHALNHVLTKRRVACELRGERVPSFTELVEHIFSS